jgi:hypothetical protein
VAPGADGLVEGAEADLPTLFDHDTGRARHLEDAIDTIRRRHGAAAVQRGRGLPEH